MRRAAFVLALTSLLSACDGGEAGTLLVDVRTDLRPGDEIVMVRTEVSPASDASIIRRAEADVSSEDPADLGRGVRVAELEDVPLGTVLVRVAAIASDGSVVVSRLVRFELEATGGITVHLSRSCVDVACPPAGGAPTLATCVSGMCSDERCSPLAADFCPAAECASDTDCDVADPVCLSPLCADDRCLRIATGEMCASTCETTETRCDDMLDDDCDGLTDCLDPSCFDDPLCCQMTEVCDNGRDDDCNMLTDCEEPSCRDLPACDFLRDSGVADSAVMDTGSTDAPECTRPMDCPATFTRLVGGCEGVCGSPGTQRGEQVSFTCETATCVENVAATASSCTPACPDAGMDTGPPDTGVRPDGGIDSGMDAGMDTGPFDTGVSDTGADPFDTGGEAGIDTGS